MDAGTGRRRARTAPVGRADARGAARWPAAIARLHARALRSPRLSHYIDGVEHDARGTHACTETAGEDPCIGHHCWRLRAYCEMLGSAVGLAAGQMEVLRKGALIHDIGKLGIPDSILLKPGVLTDEERRVMEQHTVVGETLCRPVRGMREVLPLIRHHHEHWNGSGYPDGLRGEEIPLTVRVLQIVDAYDALRSRRPYRDAVRQDKAVAILVHEAAGGKWDPALMESAIPLLVRPPALAKAS